VWNAQSGSLIDGPFDGHNNSVTSLPFLPDGQRIVTGSLDATLCVWDLHVESGVVAMLMGYTKTVFTPGFSSDNQQSQLNTLTHSLILRGHEGTVTSVSFSPDGKRIVSGSADATISMWDADSGALVSPLIKGHTLDIYSVVFSLHGKWIAPGFKDKTVHVWDVQIGVLVAGPFRGHSDTVYSVTFSPDGERVVSGSADHTIRI
jgi:WD40 repeat protein